MEMDSIRAKLQEGAPSPAEAAMLDAAIRRDVRSIQARAMIREIQQAQSANRTREEILSDPALAHWRLPSEQGGFPKLFEMVSDPSHSQAILNATLEQLEAVEKHQKTAHQAAVHAGTVYANSFVNAKLGLPPVPLESP